MAPTDEKSVPEANEERVRDQLVFSDFYPRLVAGFSQKVGTFYWKGTIPLVDNSAAEILVMEGTTNHGPTYTITITNSREVENKVLRHYRDRTFASARQAVWQLQNDVNHELYRRAKG